MEQTVLRVQMEEKRRALSDAEVKEKSRAICENVKAFYWQLCEEKGKPSIPVLSYMAKDKEADITGLHEEWKQQGARVYLPKTVYGDMEFYEYTAKEDLMKGPLGVLEPVENGAGLFVGGKSVIFVPGVAFSKQGDRMGHGSGYYDKYISRFPYFWRVGIGYECQITQELVSQAHDEMMNVLITEAGIYPISELK